MKKNILDFTDGQSLVQKLEEKEAKLQAVAGILKKEYVGLDEQIDQIIQSIRFWYLLPSAMSRPSVVCLWGMTGVGKTSLLLRLVDLIEFSSKMVIEDMGKLALSTLSPISIFQQNAQLSGNPCIFILDEMHTVSTYSETKGDTDRPSLRDFWTLIDSGILSKDPTVLINTRSHILSLLSSMAYEKKNPIVPDAPDLTRYFSQNDFDYYKSAMDISEKYEQIISTEGFDPEAYLRLLLLKVDECMSKRTVYDYKQSLIFLTGNLDDLVSYGHGMDNDSSAADELNAFCLKITISEVKKSLLTRFRPEQVARMGNIHLFFPSLSEKSFRLFIDKKLLDVASYVRENFGIGISFTEPLKELLYRHGVVPTQGCRSILSTITNMVESRIPSWLIKLIYTRKQQDLNVDYSIENEKIVVSVGFDESRSVIEEIVMKPSPDDLTSKNLEEAHRAVVAIHEIGHAVAGILSYKMLPKRVLLGTSIPGVLGLVEFPRINLISKESGEAIIKYTIGGRVAEKIVFGESKLTSGSSYDLVQATTLLSEMISQYGMGSHLSHSAINPMNPNTVTSLKKQDDKINEKWLKELEESVTQMLSEQKKLIIAFYEVLMVKGHLNQTDLKELTLKHLKASEAEKESIITTKMPFFDQEYLESIKALKRSA